MPTIHSDIHAYLRQQREMYGDVLYTDTVTPVPMQITETEVDMQPEPPSTPLAELHGGDTSAFSSQGAGSAFSSQGAASAFAIQSLDEFNAAIGECLLCPLGFTRKSFVFGSGNANADLMIIGEAPGADEDEQGKPFVGRAGQLLTKILEAVDIQRDDVYICNILKCRPPNNRKPLVSETDTCEPYLRKQIELVQPRFILALGLTAANTLLKNKESMAALRGRMHDYHGTPTLVTYHPAALLRNPDWKKHTWEDVKHLKSLLTAAD